MLTWINNFFAKRNHQTRNEWSLLAVADLRSGVVVVQGSGVGPVCLIVYIDDLAKVLEKIVSWPNCLLKI